MDDVGKIICLIQMNAHYPVLKRKCLDLAKTNSVVITFYFYSNQFDLSRQISDAKECGFQTIISNPVQRTNLDKDNSLKLFARLFNNNFICKTIRQTRDNIKIISNFIKIIKAVNPDLVLISSNTFTLKTSLFIKSVKLANKPIFNIPFGFKTPSSIFNKRNLRRLFSGHLTGLLFPRYLLKFQCKHYFPLSPHLILSLELLSAGPKRPWTWNAHDINGVFVDCPFSYDLHLRQGVPETQMIKVNQGIIPPPTLSLNNGMDRKYGIDSNSPILLINIPAPIKAVLDQDFCKIKDPNVIIESFLEIPEEVSQEVNIVWSVHPRLKKEDYLYARKWNVIMSEESAEEILPYCHICVGCDSTLFKSALYLKIPVINYQIFGRDAIIFNHLDGCFRVTNRSDYHDILRKLITDKEFYRQVKSSIISHYFGYDSSKSQSLTKHLEKILFRSTS